MAVLRPRHMHWCWSLSPGNPRDAMHAKLSVPTYVLSFTNILYIIIFLVELL